MFYTDGKLQFPVRVGDARSPLCACLQQAIGGVEGEIRVAMQYFFQACGARGNPKFRDMLLKHGDRGVRPYRDAGNSRGTQPRRSALSVKEDISADSVGGSVLNGINMKNLLSSGLSAMPVDSDGVPFDMSHIYASGNIAADMTAISQPNRPAACWPCGSTHDQRPGHEGDALLPDRARYHAPEPVDGRARGAGGATGAFPIPNSFPRIRNSRSSAMPGSASWPMAACRLGALVGRQVDRRQGQFPAAAGDAAWPEAGAGPGQADERRAERTDQPVTKAGRRLSGRRPLHDLDDPAVARNDRRERSCA